MTGTNLTVVTQELKHRLPMFQQILPPSVTPERLMRTVLISIERNPKILDCTPQSIMNAATTAAVLGAEVDGVTGQGFLIPYRDNKSGTTVCTFQPGYKLYNSIGARAGVTINGGVVREGDEFDYMEGTGGYVKHRKLLTDTTSRRIVAAWATAEAHNRPANVVVMGIEDILAIKERSPGARKKDSPWNDFHGPGFPAMCEKTAKRRLARSLPLSAMQQAVALENRLDQGDAAWLDEKGDVRTVGEGRVEGPRIVDVQPEDLTTPANKPEWPTFKKMTDWAVWSRDEFLPTATMEQAQGWHAWYRPQLERVKALADGGNEGWEMTLDGLLKLYGERVA